MPSNTPLIEARDLTCTFGQGKNRIVAVDHQTFAIHEGEIVTLVGESGSGKTTLAKMLLNLQRQTSGELLFYGKTITEPKNHFRKVQGVFQDPFSSFNQFYTVKEQLMDCFNLLVIKPSKQEMQKRITDALAEVNIDSLEVEGKYPFELSGGQMQRLLLARIFIIKPEVLIADEPTSMIDACSRIGILDFLLDLKRKLGMTIIFITHDIGLAGYVSDRIFIMREGKIVEQGPPSEIISTPKHDYTKNLLSSIPSLNDDKWIK